MDGDGGGGEAGGDVAVVEGDVSWPFSVFFVLLAFLCGLLFGGVVSRADWCGVV